MNILFTLYLKNQFEVDFFVSWMLPSMFDEGNCPWDQRDVKSRVVIFAEKRFNDRLETHPLIQRLIKSTIVNLENHNAESTEQPWWFYQTICFKYANFAYAEWIDKQWWCPLKANVIYRKNSWNSIIDYMRGGAINGLFSKPIKIRRDCITLTEFSKKNFNDFLHDVNFSSSEKHGFLDSPYFDIQSSEGNLYTRINGCGVLQMAFLKWPVAVKCDRMPTDMLHRVDKDFIQYFFKGDDWLKHLETEEFGWVEVMEKEGNFHGYNPQNKVYQIQDWAANGFNCEPIHRLIVRTTIPILHKPLMTERQRLDLMTAEFTMKSLIAEALNV